MESNGQYTLNLNCAVQIVPGQKFIPDPAYDLIENKEPAQFKCGAQCGRCGMKFDYGKSYGYYCTDMNCPMQHRAICSYTTYSFRP